MSETVNLFRLFKTQAEWEEAQDKIKAVCLSAAQKIFALQEEYGDCGAGDSASRDEILNYIGLLLRHMAMGTGITAKKAADEVEACIKRDRMTESEEYEGELGAMKSRLREAQDDIDIVQDWLHNGRFKLHLG
jgi:hypothetical protein